MMELNPLQAQISRVYESLLPPPPPTLFPSQNLDFANASSLSSFEDPNLNRAPESGEYRRHPFFSAMLFLFDVVSYPFAVVYYSLCYAFSFVSNFVQNWLRDGSFSGVEFVPPQNYVDILPNFSLPTLQLSAEVSLVASEYRTNLQKIKEAPDNLNLAEIVQGLEHVAGGPIHLAELLGHFDNLFAGRTEYNNKPTFTDREVWNIGIMTVDAPCMKTTVGHFIQFVSNRVNIPGVTSSSYFDNMRSMLQAIIFQMRNPAVSEDKKRQVFFELSQGFECAPRRYSEVERQFRFIYNRPETADAVLRRWFMEFKQELILERFQKSEFHVINSALATIGTSWGLSDGVPLGENDPFRRIGHRCKPEHFERILNQGCVPGRMIHFIEAKMDIDRDPHGRPIREENIIDFWRAQVSGAHGSGLITDEDAYGALYPNGDRPLTPKGIAFMLSRAGYLDRV